NKLYVEFVSLHHVLLMDMLAYDCQNKSLKLIEYVSRVLEELKRFCDGNKDLLDYLACLCNGLSDMQNKFITKNVKKNDLLSYITSSINSFHDKYKLYKPLEELNASKHRDLQKKIATALSGNSMMDFYMNNFIGDDMIQSIMNVHSLGDTDQNPADKVTVQQVKDEVSKQCSIL
ncbi:hypothetical protein COBT_001730, partial [Conglomerata obtusa]